MEKELFYWTGWDQGDTASFTFYNVELRQTIGDFPAGTKFGCAFVDYENSALQLVEWGDGGEPDKYFDFKLSLNVLGPL